MQKKYILLLLGCIAMSTVIGQHNHAADAHTATKKDTASIQKEEDFYKIINIPIPRHIALEVGGMVFLPGDKLAVCTRRGEVWVISNPYMRNGEPPQYKLFAKGLHEALGMNLIGGDLYVVHRSEVTRLRDLNADGEADEYKTVYTWPLAGNYHEYAYGSILDKQGNMVINLNLGWIEKGESLSKWDGWMLKVDTAGNMKPYATGLRSPAGMGINQEGAIFYTENQGDWVGSGYVAHVAEGDFMGNPSGLKWSGEPGSPVKLRIEDIPNTGEPKYEVAKRVPGLKPPAVWLPHTIFGVSTSDMLLSDGQGKMGPFEDQFFVGDQGHSKIMRVAMEKVKGVYQGVAFAFREGFSSGVLRMKWGSDGSMLVGMTSRGWGSSGGSPFGLQRLEWNGKTPFVMKTIKAKPDGFEIEFTEPVDMKYINEASYSVTSFTYEYGQKYGSPVINDSKRVVKAAEVSPDGLRVRLVLDSLKPGYIHEIKADGIRSRDNFLLMHNVGYYTLNQIPEGTPLTITDTNRVIEPVEEVEPAEEVKAKKGQQKVAATQVKRQIKKPAGWSKVDQEIVIKPVPGLKYDQTNIIVKAGAKVELTFDNTDDMPHNVVITAPGAADEMGAAALNLGLNGERLHYVPQSSKVLFYTGLLQPGKSETIYFTAPTKPGNYPFVCTYPGHYLVMRGVLKVVADK